MNVAVISSSLAAAPPRATPRNSFGNIHLHDCVPTLLGKKRVLINVRGYEYETYQSTLDQFPGTLLGSKRGRAELYNPDKVALVLDRNPTVFDSILFFYQSNGILAKPDDVSERLFNEELQFYGIDTLQVNKEDEAADAGGDEIRRLSQTEQSNGNSQACACEKRLREKIWKAFEYPWTSSVATVWAYISVAAIIFSVAIFCLETTALVCPVATDMNNATRSTGRFCLAKATWSSMEQAVVIFFTAEFVLRLYAAPRKLIFIKSALALIDLAAIVPYYITISFGFGYLPSLTVLRLCRVIRVMKLSRYSTGLKLIGQTLSDSLKTMGSLMASVIMTVVFFSSIMYLAENSPESKFRSIPDSFWWAIVTMTTVGYGDMVPVTILGRVASSFCAISGIIFLYILPLPAFVMNFSKRYEESLKKKAAGKLNNRKLL